MRPSRTSPISAPYARARALVALVLAVGALQGCQPSCDQVCEKLVACENPGTERLTAPECAESCRAQEELYQTWNDVALREAFDDHLTCLYQSECAEVADGVCYDEAVFSF